VSALNANFWAKVEKDDVTDCWLWTGALNSRGYGAWGVDGRSRSTHRVAYESLVGPIPDGLTIDHLCREKRCCNPAHLEPVTVGENTRRARELITRCPQGHEYTPENTLVKKGTNSRSCRECNNARRRKHPVGEGRRIGQRNRRAAERASRAAS
jgi:hypothetical protein